MLSNLVSPTFQKHKYQSGRANMIFEDFMVSLNTQLLCEVTLWEKKAKRGAFSHQYQELDTPLLFIGVNDKILHFNPIFNF